MSAEHNFFATSHGIYSCDAVSGSIKCVATRASLQCEGAHVIATPLQSYNFVEEKMPNVTFDYVMT